MFLIITYVILFIQKNKTVRHILFLYLLSVIAFNAAGQNYFLTTSKDGVEEVYIMSVTSNRTNNTMVVFDRVKPAEGKLQDFRHNVAKVVDKDKMDIDKLGYYRRKIQYSCADKTYRIMETTYYELTGKEIDKIENKEKDTEWRKIYPGSIIDVEFKKICKK